MRRTSALLSSPSRVRLRAIARRRPRPPAASPSRAQPAGHGAARHLGHPPHLRRDPGRPLLRPGLRGRPGPAVPDGALAPRGRGPARRGPRTGRRSSATASPACSATGATWRPSTRATPPTPGRSCEAFVRGVNAYIETVSDRLPIEFQLAGFRPEPWTPEVCLSRVAALGVTGNAPQEVMRGHPRSASWERRPRRSWSRPSRPCRWRSRRGSTSKELDPKILAGFRAAGARRRASAATGTAATTGWWTAPSRPRASRSWRTIRTAPSPCPACAGWSTSSGRAGT